MEERILRTIHAEYLPAPYMGENKSGYLPVGDNVLIRPDFIARKTSGGVELPDDLAERMQLAAMTGVIVECGDDAFAWNADRTRRFEGYRPRPGDRVIFEKYSGKPFLGSDGQNYRMMTDTCIGGIAVSKSNG